jgi:hypothetical protein
MARDLTKKTEIQMATTGLSQIPTELARQLTPKQREFLRLCVARGARNSDGVAAQCYLDAGFKVTFESARSCAGRVLRGAAARAYVRELETLREQAALEEMKTEWIACRAKRRSLSEAKIVEGFETDISGKLVMKPFDEMPESLQSAINSVEISEDRNGKQRIKIGTEPKAQHLQALETRFSILPDNEARPTKLELSGQVSVEAIPPRAERMRMIDDVITRWEKEKAGAERVVDIPEQPES